MTIAEAIAMTALVLTVGAIVAATSVDVTRCPDEKRRRTIIAATLAITAGVGYIAAIWTHTLT